MYAQPLIGDIDNDGQNEVVTVGYYDSPSLSSSVVIYGQNLQHKYTISTQSMFVYGGYPIAVADVDRDGLTEIFVQNADGFLRCYHHNGTLVWTSSATVSGPDSKSPGLILADINGDGIPEIWSLNKIFNAVSGVELIALPEIVGKANLYMSSDKFGVMPVFADFDNDGYPEILFTFGTNLAAYRYVAASQSLQQLWLKSTSDLSGATTLTAFDFNQDGSVEIVYRDQSDMRIIDGNTGNNISVFPCLAPTAVEYPAIADLDRDGQADIIASSSTYDVNHDKHAKMVMFHSLASTVWAPARHVWNQHAYNVVNVNNDLTVPSFNFNPSTTFTDPNGVVRRPFNNFLQQATTLDHYGRPFMPLANLAIAGEPVLELGSEVLSLEMEVCNTGETTFPAPIFFSVYTATGQLVLTEAQSQSLQPGVCVTVTLSISQDILKRFDNPYPLRIIVNDNGEGTAQYGGLQAECDTSDNTFHIDGRPCEITLYNVITPNGDGFNDAFEPQLEGDFVNIEMEIYDRWSKRVYRQEGKEAPRWDATGMPDGVYFCAIDYWCATSAKKRQRTNTSVTVVR